MQRLKTPSNQPKRKRSLALSIFKLPSNEKSMQTCQAIADYKRMKKCGNHATMNGRRVCDKHEKRAVDDEDKCAGAQIDRPWSTCPNKAQDGSKYCMRQHNPSISYIDPKMFRKPDLRSNRSMVQHIIQDQKNEDAYLQVDLPAAHDYQVEHVEECQMVAAKFSKVKFKSKAAEKKTISVLHDITNGRGNLRVVSTWANYAKEKAVEAFLNDFCQDKARPLAKYLEEAHYDKKQFSKKQINTICREMKLAMKYSSDQLRISKSKLPDDVYKQLKQHHKSMVNALQLKASSRTGTVTRSAPLDATGARLTVSASKEESSKSARASRVLSQRDDRFMQGSSSSKVSRSQVRTPPRSVVQDDFNEYSGSASSYIRRLSISPRTKKKASRKSRK